MKNKNKLQQKICAIFQRTINAILHIFSKLCVSLKRDNSTTEKDLYEKEKCGKFWKNIKIEIMSRLPKFRKGDKAEYLTKYLISNFAFINESNRQEDYGVDFYCGLLKKTKNKKYLDYDKPFLLQVKCNKKSIIYEKKEEIDSLFNLNIPLFIGHADVKNKVLEIYSTSMMWHVYFTSRNNPTKIEFKHRIKKSDGDVGFPDVKSLPYDYAKFGNLQHYTIDLGNPILKITMDDVDNEQDDLNDKYSEILRNVIIKEFDNITAKELNTPYLRWCHKYKTNELDNFEFGWVIYDENDVDILEPSESLHRLHHYLISLAFSFRANNQKTNYENICKITKLIDQRDRLNEIVKDFPEIYGLKKNKGK